MAGYMLRLATGKSSMMSAMYFSLAKSAGLLDFLFHS